MGTKGVAATAAWVCQVSKGLREVHSTGCWWGIGILPSITFARLLSLKEKKGTNLQYRLHNSQSFSQINLFFKIWSTGMVSESYTQKSCKPHIHTGHVSERKKTASLQTFCLTVRMDLTTQKYGLFCSPWPTVNEMGLDCNVKTCNVNLKNHSATIMYYLPAAVSSFMMKAKTSKRYYYFFYSSHTKLLLFFNFQH